MRPVFLIIVGIGRGGFGWAAHRRSDLFRYSSSGYPRSWLVHVSCAGLWCFAGRAIEDP